MRHQPSLPDPAQFKLRECYERWHRSSGHSDRTTEDYRKALDHWERVTEDPPVSAITNVTLREFRERLLTTVPPRRKRPLSKTTVAKYMREIQAILATIGPAQYGNPDGLGIIDRLPTCRKPSLDPPVVVTASTEEVSAIYRACRHATWPPASHAGIDPVDWWRTLLVYLFNVGSRRDEFLGLRIDQVDLEQRRIYVNSQKHGDRNYRPMHSMLVAHLKLIWSQDREFVFPAPRSRKSLYRTWHKIQTHAGIAVYRPDESIRKPFYGFHEMRKTCGTSLADLSLAAAQHMLGHRSIDTTRRYYVDGSKVSTTAVEQLRQPSAFGLPSPPHKPDPPNDRPTFRVVG